MVTLTTGKCACTMNSVTNPTCLCPAGKTCINGDIGEVTCSIVKTGTSCPKGTYQTYKGAKSANECKICPLGSYCPTLMACEIGTTCASAALMSSTCPLGKSCYYGTQHYLACPAGTYGRFDMLDAADSTGGSTRYCEPCPAGYKCTTTGMVIP